MDLRLIVNEKNVSVNEYDILNQLTDMFNSKLLGDEEELTILNDTKDMVEIIPIATPENPPQISRKKFFQKRKNQLTQKQRTFFDQDWKIHRKDEYFFNLKYEKFFCCCDIREVRDLDDERSNLHFPVEFYTSKEYSFKCYVSVDPVIELLNRWKFKQKKKAERWKLFCIPKLIFDDTGKESFYFDENGEKREYLPIEVVYDLHFITSDESGFQTPFSGGYSLSFGEDGNERLFRFKLEISYQKEYLFDIISPPFKIVMSDEDKEKMKLYKRGLIKKRKKKKKKRGIWDHLDEQIAWVDDVLPDGTLKLVFPELGELYEHLPNL